MDKLSTGQVLAEMVSEYHQLMQQCNFVAAQDQLDAIASMATMLSNSMKGIRNG